MSNNGKTQYQFYTVGWSRSCQQAEELIVNSGIDFSKYELKSFEQLSGLSRDLGVNRVPVLQNERKIYEGLGPIRDFIRGK
jgi:hypothetical protein